MAFLKALPDTEPDTLTGSLPLKPRVHPIVKLDYGVRAVSHLLVGTVMLLVLVAQPVPIALWVVLFFTTFLWPHLAYQVSSRAEESKKAELRNLLFDALIVGAWSTVAGFSFWTATSFFCSLGLAPFSRTQ